MNETSTQRHRYEAIWAVVHRIPCGRVASYGQVAALAGYPRQPRLAGQALHHAPPGLPWHRVLNAQGRISLPADSASAREQAQRLRDEGVLLKNGRVDLAQCRWRSPSEAPLLD